MPLIGVCPNLANTWLLLWVVQAKVPADDTLFREGTEPARVLASDTTVALSSWLVPLAELPLRTQGPFVVSATGNRKTLACANWYGAHMSMRVNNGLNKRPMHDISKTIAELGFNCVRLPFSLDMVVGNNSSDRISNAEELLAANPELQHLSSLKVFDATVQSLTDAGLLVILNNHVSRGAWCCDNQDGEGLWWTAEFSEEDWLYSLAFIAKRYRDNQRVVGFDLRNEIRDSPLGSPDWGSGNPKTDWALAATKAGLRVLDASPEMLIIISGISYSMFLCDVPRHPLHLIVPEFRNRTIYTSHEYDWYRSVLGESFNVASIMCRQYMRALAGVLCVALLLALGQMLKGRVLPSCFYRRSNVFPLSLIATGALTTSCYVLVIIVGRRFLDGCSSSSMSQSTAFFKSYIAVLTAFWLPSLVSGSCLLIVPVLRMKVASEAISSEDSEIELGELHMQVADSNKGLDPQPKLTEMEAAPVLMGQAGSPVANLASARKSERTSLITPALRRSIFAQWLTALAMASSMAPLLVFLESYEVFEESLDLRWGFLQGSGLTDSEKIAHPEVAPVWLGEFGTAGNSIWWKHMMRYLSHHPVAGWAYWPVNGEKRPGEDESYGLLMEDMQTIRHPWKVKDLQKLAADKLAEDGLQRELGPG
mmetsp:Transcript_101343/g.180140  ORF Transcript_101343/g.180140 Transcript_101343/m.180140 type:complete len:650 (-) Transcript_101343:229-2178(-)|eukprot:CAMPEP_0197641502 /NCGR_PEP_ID=MMETSP1338-20131121/15455_1 /TAXON_ID=43686 ORGANISM="Pelagodinium beii, Strain RCC1491" /NCGR_SAMPLE_ID=MMETSP1338 /ASSEMBLY_ACC=CAM_ASM_000754 /LENGTH=649 /DNA_ID=CAMNT_0043214503 /DNA_START=57 /DNA_END=2006 /DNA_ORIENTATION=-